MGSSGFGAGKGSSPSWDDVEGLKSDVEQAKADKVSAIQERNTAISNLTDEKNASRAREDQNRRVYERSAGEIYNPIYETIIGNNGVFIEDAILTNTEHNKARAHLNFIAVAAHHPGRPEHLATTNNKNRITSAFNVQHYVAPNDIDRILLSYGGQTAMLKAADQIEQDKDYRRLSAETIDRSNIVTYTYSEHHGKLIVTEIIHDDNGTIVRAAETFGEYAL